ncbi:MAG: hypothetical protein J5623_03290 [Clostridiales bacterium]|nr:hypothetical protein [Clostridiales bacterium]
MKSIKTNIESMLVIFALLVVAFVISLLSPVNVFLREGMNYTDQSVFQYIARIIEHGGVPYRDVFDHKGPLIYFINLLGIKINYEYGIWWVEFATLFISLCGAYMISRRFLNRPLSLIVAILSFASLVGSFAYGNLTELYALPFQIFSLYFFVEYHQLQTTSNFKVFLCGMFFSAVILLKLNLIAVWVVFLICIFVSMIRKKKYRFLLSCILYFCIGMLLLILPFVIYFWINGAINDFIYDYLIFNTIYSFGNNTFISRMSCIWSFISVPITFISLALLVLFCFVKSEHINKKLNFIGLVYFIVNLLLVTLSGNVFIYYGIAIIPSTIIPLIEAFEAFSKGTDFHAKFKKTMCITTAVLLIALHYSFVYVLFNRNIAENRRRLNNYLELNQYIETYSKPDEPIICYGNDVLVYNFSHRFAASKYAFLPYRPFDNLFLDEYLSELESSKPSVFIQLMEPDERIMMFLNKNHYRKIAKVDWFTVYANDK